MPLFHILFATKTNVLKNLSAFYILSSVFASLAEVCSLWKNKKKMKNYWWKITAAKSLKGKSIFCTKSIFFSSSTLHPLDWGSGSRYIFIYRNNFSYYFCFYFILFVFCTLLYYFYFLLLLFCFFFFFFELN